MSENKEKEICREYRQSKDKAEKVDILAQLNDCSREEIVAVLEKNGFDIPPKKWTRKNKVPKEKKEDALNTVKNPMPESVKEALIEKMEFIDLQIKQLESQYIEIANYLCS